MSSVFEVMGGAYRSHFPTGVMAQLTPKNKVQIGGVISDCTITPFRGACFMCASETVLLRVS